MSKDYIGLGYLVQNFDSLAGLEVAWKFGVGGVQVSLVFNLNPSCIVLELCFGFDNKCFLMGKKYKQNISW